MLAEEAELHRIDLNGGAVILLIPVLDQPVVNGCEADDAVHALARGRGVLRVGHFPHGLLALTIAALTDRLFFLLGNGFALKLLVLFLADPGTHLFICLALLRCHRIGFPVLRRALQCFLIFPFRFLLAFLTDRLLLLLGGFFAPEDLILAPAFRLAGFLSGLALLCAPLLRGIFRLEAFFLFGLGFLSRFSVTEQLVKSSLVHPSFPAFDKHLVCVGFGKMAIVAEMSEDVQQIAIIRLLIDAEQQQSRHRTNDDADAELIGQIGENYQHEHGGRDASDKHIPQRYAAEQLHFHFGFARYQSCHSPSFLYRLLFPLFVLGSAFP